MFSGVLRKAHAMLGCHANQPLWRSVCSAHQTLALQVEMLDFDGFKGDAGSKGVCCLHLKHMQDAFHDFYLILYRLLI